MGLFVGDIDKSWLPTDITSAMLSSSKIYGVTFDGSSHVGIRLYDSIGLRWTPSSEAAAGIDDFKDLAPFNVKKCVTQYNSSTGKREVLAYEGDTNYATLIANKTGDRMVEFPKFYYKRPNKWTWLVSPDYVQGFLPSPMHFRNGTMHDVVRVSEYMLSTSGSTVISQPGSNPRVSTPIADFRTILRAKGQYVIDRSSYDMIAILAIIKYGDLNAELVNGSGHVSGNNTITLNDSIKGLDGYRTSLTDNLNIRVMGIEDFYGNAWTFIDGVFQYAGNVYVNNDIENIEAFPDMTNYVQKGWTKLDTTIPQGVSNKYFNNIAFDSKDPSIMFPTSTGGDDSNPIGDGYWTGSGNTQSVVLAGGSGWDGSLAGLLTWGSGAGLSFSDIYFGAFALEVG